MRRSACLCIFIVMASFAGANVLAQQTGLPGPDLLYFRFDEGTGTTSASGALAANPPSATLVGSAGWVTSGAPVGAAALAAGTAAGDVAYANTPFSLSGAFTIEFWMRAAPGTPAPPGTPVGTTPLPIGNIMGDPTASGFAIQSIYNYTTVVNGLFFPQYTIRMMRAGSVITQVVVGGPTLPIPANGWMHIAFTRDFPSLPLVQMVINGALVAPNGASAFAACTGTRPQGLAIGGDGVNPPLLNGEIDEVRFWSEAHSASQIAAGMSVPAESFRADELVFTLPAPPIAMNATSSTYTLSTLVAGWSGGQTFSSYAPALDPIVGAVVAMSGGYTGQDTLFMSDVAFSPTALTIVAGANDSLSVTSAFSPLAPNGGVRFSLGGPLATQPIASIRLGATGPRTVVRTGSGSRVLDVLANDLSNGGNLFLTASAGLGGRVAIALERTGTIVPATPVFHAATDFAGGFQMGGVGHTPGTRLYHVFAMNSTIAPGTGIFFGLDFGPFQMEQLQLPYPVTPFKVAADSRGLYYFATPSGALPPGLTVDVVEIAAQAGASVPAWVSGVTRLTF